MLNNIESLLRRNIDKKVYYEPRFDAGDEISIFMDCQENLLGASLKDSGLNYLSDPWQKHLKDKIASIKGIPSKHMFISNGNEQVIDILIRLFVEPTEDNIINILPNSYTIDKCARLNNVEIRQVPLLFNHNIDLELLSESIDDKTKIIFLSSPNVVIGSSVISEDIEIILKNFKGIVFIDETFINYSKNRSLLNLLTKYNNLIILQSLSAAWGLSGLNLSISFSSEEIVDCINYISPCFNINTVSQSVALDALENIEETNKNIKETIEQKNILIKELETIPLVEKIYPSDSNFIVVKFKYHDYLFDFLKTNGILVKDCSSEVLCENSLQITISNKSDNQKLISIIKQFLI